MRTVKRYVVQRISQICPSTRLFRIRNKLYRWGEIDIANGARVVSSTSFVGNGNIHIGPDSFLGHECLLVAAGAPIFIGASVDIGPRVYIGTGSHEIDMLGQHSAGRGTSAPVVIEDGVWVGAGSIILPGVRVGRKTVIAAGSVVTRDVPEFSLAAGVPCRVRRLWSRATNTWVPTPSATASGVDVAGA